MTDKRAQLESEIGRLRSELSAAIGELEALDSPTVRCEAETKRGVRCGNRVKGKPRCRMHPRGKR